MDSVGESAAYIVDLSEDGRRAGDCVALETSPRVTVHKLRTYRQARAVYLPEARHFSHHPYHLLLGLIADG